tara:strand:+ start:748 stop:1785 length:1038 start_codon:yes stop_codon:yes gene_type:complete
MAHLLVVEEWLKDNTYDKECYSDISHLLTLKNEKGKSVAVVFPTLEEELTIGDTLKCITDQKLDGIIDELVVMDGGSKDNTKIICEQFKSVKFYNQHDIIPDVAKNNGKGEALWKSLYVTKSDIIIYVDSDIKNFDERFVIGILAPLLINDDIKFSKGYYSRPFMPTEGVKTNEGGRVTELAARPLLNALYPELSGFIQPLGGEYGGYREVLENIEYTSGYGIEVQSLIEIYTKFGLNSMAQVNLIERQHRHQPINSLSKMSFAIQQTILKKHIVQPLNSTIMIKNINKENSEYVKSRSAGQVHCNCNGSSMNNENFKVATIQENILPCMSEIKERNQNELQLVL